MRGGMESSQQQRSGAMSLSANISKIIRLANQKQIAEQERRPKYQQAHKLFDAGSGFEPASPEAATLRSFVKTLPAMQIYGAVMIMYVGRGDISPRKMQSHYRYISE